jgi:Na+/proline symporter
MDRPLEKQIKDRLSHFVLLHDSSFWFMVMVLLWALIITIFCIRLTPHIQPNQCHGVNENKEAKQIVSVLHIFSVIGIIFISFALLFISLHYFHPFVIG